MQRFLATGDDVKELYNGLKYDSDIRYELKGEELRYIYNKLFDIGTTTGFEKIEASELYSKLCYLFGGGKNNG